MTTTAEVREAFTAISTALANAVSAARATDDPFTTLVAHIDQARGFINDMATAVDDIEPDPDAKVKLLNLGLSCAGCIQDARNDEAEGKTPRPILPASTVIQGLALCDREGRHRIVTAVQHAVAQRSGILLPGQGGPMRGGMVG